MQERKVNPVSVKSTIGFLRRRLGERSTYLFITGAMGSVAVLPKPFNWIGFIILAVAAFVPDGPVP
jgi:hypothetical protein